MIPLVTTEEMRRLESAADAAKDTAQIVLLEKNLQVLVGGVKDREIGPPPRKRRLAPQNAGARRVKGRDPDVAAQLGNKGGDALAHFPRRLVCERYREYVPGRHAPLLDQVGDAVRQGPGLAAARAGQNKQRAVPVRDGLKLRCVQVLQVRPQSITSRKRVFLHRHLPPLYAHLAGDSFHVLLSAFI